MSLKRLAQGIIPQSVEDLYDGRERRDCILFVNDNDFSTCARAAGMDTTSQIRLHRIVKRTKSAVNIKSIKTIENPEEDMSTLIRRGV